MNNQQQKQKCRSLSYKLPPVSIPEQLIKAIEDYGTRRFVKVEKPIKGQSHTGKAAFEKGHKNYDPYDAELQKWLLSGGNYGMLFSNGIIGIDLDHPDLVEIFKDVKTLRIKSGRKGAGKHLILKSNLDDNKTLFLDPKEKNSKNIGNIQVKRKYLVAPNSLHNSWNRYQIIDDSPIAEMNTEKIEKRLKDYMRSEKQQKQATSKRANQENELLGNQIPLTKLIDTSNFMQLSRYELQGEHPVHGSNTGQNFCVNTQKNSWYCFRCGSGGGSLLWLLVKNGVIDCSEAGAGVIRGQMFEKALELAEKEGFPIDRSNPKLAAQIASKYFKINKRGQLTDKFVPARLGEDLMEQGTYLTRIKDKKIFRYNPNTGIYDEHGDVDIQQKVAQTLGEEYKQHRVNETKSYIQARTYRDLADTPLHLIALKNGLLDINTMQLKPFSSTYFILNSHPIEYDPTAECPRWQQFLTEVIDDPDDIKVLQEWYGYCFYRDYTFKHSLIVQGGTDAGKTTALNVLYDIVGEQNSASVTLQDLHKNRFKLAELYKKTVNIADDLSATSVKDIDIYKKATGKSTLSAEYKHQTSFDFQNYAKLTFSANRPPQIENVDEATFNRMMYIIFPHTFPKDSPKRDNNLDKKLKAEHQGIFNWAIEGLKRLLKNSRFTRYRTINETAELHNTLSDPIGTFIEEQLEPKNNCYITKGDIYKQAFDNWTKRKNITDKPTYKEFNKKLKEHYIGKPKKCAHRVWHHIIIQDPTLIPNPTIPLNTPIENERHRTQQPTVIDGFKQKNIQVQESSTMF